MKHPNFSRLITHKIRGKAYKLVWRKPRNSCLDPEKHDVGLCDYPSSPGKELWLWPKQDFKDMLATVIHECTHGAFPDIEESAVEEFERDVMRLLTRMGIEGKFNPK